MSYKHVNAIRDSRGLLQTGERLVALVVASYIWSKEDESFPSVGRMAEDCGMSRRHFQRVTARLQAMGIFAVKDRFRPNGSQASSFWDPGPNFPWPAQGNRGEDDTGVMDGMTRESPLERSIKEKSPQTPQGVRDEEFGEKEVLEIYNEERGGLKKLVPARWPGSQHSRALRARLKEHTEHRTERFWRGFFKVARENPTWNGGNHRGWSAGLPWLVNRTNFDKVVERWANNEQN